MSPAETGEAALAPAPASARADKPFASPIEPDPARAEASVKAPDAPPVPRPGADSPPAPTTRTGAVRFSTGWVYLGNHVARRWATRYFDGWKGPLPSRGQLIRARGRSNVRTAMPDLEGFLGEVRTTIGEDNPVRVLEVRRWLEGGYVWARVRPAWTNRGASGGRATKRLK